MLKNWGCYTGNILKSIFPAIENTCNVFTIKALQIFEKYFTPESKDNFRFRKINQCICRKLFTFV